MSEYLENRSINVSADFWLLTVAMNFEILGHSPAAMDLAADSITPDKTEEPMIPSEVSVFELE